MIVDKSTLIIFLVAISILGYFYVSKEQFQNYGPALLKPRNYDIWPKNKVWKNADKYDSKTINEIDALDDKKDFCDSFATKSCKLPLATSRTCWLNEYQNCNYQMYPGDPRKYRQCTNNNLEVPNNLPCECGNRSFDVCPFKNRISDACYANNFNRCMYQQH